ncbi:MAG: hypothetical protein PHP95_12110 [Desulfuromonadaceae bacterium]|nr:hypothetical protein [Desulfuromonadaceae bacterium]MDD2849190.1 hypothetical protein [Desulfuromonadaceae bacterium]MDD4129761.1 hypothetical protein [Desulfuromonadaceae bacterium]
MPEDKFFLRDQFFWQTVKEDLISGGAGDRAIAAFKAEVGLVAGSAQLVYWYSTKGLTSNAIGVHGVGNYLGSIGDLSNVIYGGNRNWNVTKTNYEKASKAVLGETKYGAAAFHTVDFAMGLYTAFKPVGVVEKVAIGGVQLERYRNIPSELLLPGPIIVNDLFSEFLNGSSVLSETKN